jgi:hypothetical protein
MSRPDIAKECPRWSACSVNRCPLGASYPNQVVHPDDKEKRCPMEKAVRLRIAAKYPGQLVLGGLTAREAAGKRIYDELPLAVKSRLIETGKSNLTKMNSGKGVQNG